MYQSRYHFTNGKMSVAVDSITGELLELVHAQSGENLIKNSSFQLPQPFILRGRAGERTVTLHPGNARQIAEDEGLRAKIWQVHRQDEELEVHVLYERLMGDGRIYDVRAEYVICLGRQEAKSTWQMTFENKEPGLSIKEAQFPCINGVYWGSRWEDNTMVYPYHAGIQLKNPIQALETEPKRIYWKWQEYRYAYLIDGLVGTADSNGLYALECKYSGNLSMTWLDYFGEEYGLYFGCHNPDPDVCALRADTWGSKSPGMNFSFRFDVGENLETWTSPPVVAAIHSGDWHKGAAIYRDFRQQYMPAVMPRPEWFEKSPGLIAHYDFQYQNGGIVHTYQDLGRLLDEAEDFGIEHLLLAGWHRDGFDQGFPMYQWNKDLGEEREFQEGVAAIRQKGGHVSLYINSRLANLKYGELQEFIQKYGVKLHNQELMTECYGRDDVNFAVMCAGSQQWQQWLEHAVSYGTDTIGVDGVYLDQLAMAPPCRCYSQDHTHTGWNQGYQKLLEQILSTSGNDFNAIHEGVSDLYGTLSSGQLISTFFITIMAPTQRCINIHFQTIYWWICCIQRKIWPCAPSMWGKSLPL